MTLFEIALFALFALQVADVWSTNRVLAAGGREDNPALAWIMRKLGRAWWLVKLALAGAIGVILWNVGPTFWGWGAALLVGGAYAWVVRHNLAVNRRQRARR